MMTETEAIKLLITCKDLVDRVNGAFPNKTPPMNTFTEEDFLAIQGFNKLQGDPIAAGPGLLGRLELAAGLTKSDIIKLEQIRRLVYNRRHFVASSSSSRVG